jgi:hypothetical protein
MEQEGIGVARLLSVVRMTMRLGMDADPTPIYFVIFTIHFVIACADKDDRTDLDSSPLP